MQTKENQLSKEELHEILEETIEKLCGIILTTGDALDEGALKEFVDDISLDTKAAFAKMSSVTTNVTPYIQEKVLKYLKYYKNNETTSTPFAFDITENLEKFQRCFNRLYLHDIPDDVDKVPDFFGDVFKIIKETNIHYQTFTAFYDIRVKEIYQGQKEIQTIAEQTAKAAIGEEINKILAFSVQSATQKAEMAAHNAEVEATAASEKAARAAEDAVSNKMHEVTDKISETSVTILGIFSAIVLTAVSGLLYSSSVLESVKDSDVWKLVMIATVVGFVCFNLLAVMFNYIDKFRTHKEESHQYQETPLPVTTALVTKIPEDADSGQLKPIRAEKIEPGKPSKWDVFWSALWKRASDHLFVIILDALLIILFGISGCAQSCNSDPTQNINQNQYDANISLDVNVQNQSPEEGENPIPTPTIAPTTIEEPSAAPTLTPEESPEQEDQENVRE